MYIGIAFLSRPAHIPKSTHESNQNPWIWIDCWLWFCWLWNHFQAKLCFAVTFVMSRRCHVPKWPLKGQMVPKHPKHICADWKLAHLGTSHHQLEAKECLQGLSCWKSSSRLDGEDIGLQVCSYHHNIVPQHLLTLAIGLWQHLTQLFVDVWQLECWEFSMLGCPWRQAGVVETTHGPQYIFSQDRWRCRFWLHLYSGLCQLGPVMEPADLSQTCYSKNDKSDMTCKPVPMRCKRTILTRDHGAEANKKNDSLRNPPEGRPQESHRSCRTQLSNHGRPELGKVECRFRTYIDSWCHDCEERLYWKTFPIIWVALTFLTWISVLMPTQLRSPGFAHSSRSMDTISWIPESTRSQEIEIENNWRKFT